MPRLATVLIEHDLEPVKSKRIAFLWGCSTRIESGRNFTHISNMEVNTID